MIGISISPFLSALGGALQHWTAQLLSADPYLDARALPGAQVELVLLGAPQVSAPNAIVTAGSEPGAQVIVTLTGGA